MAKSKGVITITLEAQLKVHYQDKEKTKESLKKYLTLYEKSPKQTENVKFRINNFKQLIQQLEN